LDVHVFSYVRIYAVSNACQTTKPGVSRCVLMIARSPLRFERLADECMQNVDVLKRAHAKGQPAPKGRQEKRTINIVKSAAPLRAT